MIKDLPGAGYIRLGKPARLPLVNSRERHWRYTDEDIYIYIYVSHMFVPIVSMSC